MDEAAVVWFRRDLRLRDHPAILEASRRSRRALALFVLDDTLLTPSGAARTAFLYRCLRELRSELDGRLQVLRGDPVEVVPRAVAAVGARSVHVSADTGPYGRRRDDDVERALAENGTALVRTGSPYAVTPGRVRKADGEPYRVFTPFSRAWAEHGWPSPARTDSSTVDWISPGRDNAGEIPDGSDVDLPEAGELAALAAWHAFVDHGLAAYGEGRNRPDRDTTSRMSPYLRWGCIHPRTMLADLPADAAAYRTELAWRDFYADVLWNWPSSARQNFDPRFDKITHDWDRDRFVAWQRGETGYPIVDAGMRQLKVESWMHNRLRMIVASFLVKDLHLPWWWGARHFMRELVDGDLASNQHGWQWVAGCGTDAAPYFRIFNPVTQAERFDPDGEYVRRWVPELAGIDGKAVHRPWKLGEPPPDYPAPLVDHAEERQVALARFGEIKQS